MIVIDVGCAAYGGDVSIPHLIEEFHPDVLYGFDPNEKGLAEAQAAVDELDTSTKVILEAKAAWVYDGEIAFTEAGLGSHVGEGPVKVPCFDLARFIQELPEDDIVLKMDAEEAEYVLLPHLIDTGADKLLKLAWIEFHPNWVGDPIRRAPIERDIACELREWRY